MARLIVARLTAWPETACHQAQCSANSASGRAARRAGRAAGSPAVFTAAGPGTGFGATPPVSRRRRSHRLIVGSDTVNTRAASARGIPRSTAATTRRRKSSLYGLMPTACQRAQGSRNPL